MLGLLLAASTNVFAQVTEKSIPLKKPIPLKKDAIDIMADSFRADGKIYVVITVVATILVGLLIYMILLDKKIGKLEKEYKDQD